MNRSTFGDSYRYFPYKKDYTGNRTNNGGIDLVDDPERLSEITEASGFPELRTIIQSINSVESHWRTIGCEAGVGEDGSFYGYIEITPRDEEESRNEEYISTLDECFSAWVVNKWPDHGNAIIDGFSWEYDWFSFKGKTNQLKVVAFFRAQRQEYAGQLLLILEEYLAKSSNVAQQRS